MTDDKRISFLWNAAELLKPNQHVNKLLKSYYLTNIRKIIHSTSNAEYKEFDNKSICQKCSARWNHGHYTMKFVPSRAKGSRAQRLIDALNNGDKLTKKQKIRAKWYRKRIKNSFIFTCNLCQHKTSIDLEKPKNIDKKKSTEESNELQNQIEITKLKTKKKKKKDKTAGLTLTHIKPPVKDTRSPVDSTQSKSTSFTGEKNESKLLNTSINIKKSTTMIKSLSKKQQHQPKKQQQIVSKTQEKNTILQLANLLKNNFKKSTNNEHDRLKNLLR